MYHRRFRSPLTFDAKRFSKQCAIPAKFDINMRPTLSGFILKATYVYLMLMINLLLFASSGNLVVFHNSFLPTSEVFILLFFLLIFSFAVIGIFYKKPLIQNILCCIFTWWFITALYNQFYQLDANTIIGDYLSKHIGNITPGFLFANSHVIIALLLSAAFGALLFLYAEKFLIVCVTVFSIIFLGVLQKDSLHHKYDHDFTEIYSSKINDANDDNKKFIYIMLPNLSSHKTLAMMDNPAASYAYNLISGFYAKNNFEIYPNSFIEYSNQFINITQSVNAFSDKGPDSHMLSTMILYRYWQFFNINDEYIFLKNNQLYDSFRKAGYKISAYKSRGIDLCRKNHEFNVDRCIEKINFPVNLYDSGMSAFARAKLLFAEWFVSMRILNTSPVYSFLKTFANPESMPLFRVNYNNMYVVNSLKTFDVLAENILSDKGRQAYFVYADIPSDMFVYDEFCNIKNSSQWVNKEDPVWIKDNDISLKQKAYIDQTKCLFGKLQNFIDKLNQENLFDNTVLIINGLSSNHNFDKSAFEDITDNFIYDNMVTTAIKSPTIKDFIVNENICSAKSIVRNALYNIEAIGCDDVSNMGIRGSLRDELVDKIMSKKATDINVATNIEKFNSWYEMWTSINSLNTQKLDIIKHEKDLFNSDIENEAPELENITLQ